MSYRTHAEAAYARGDEINERDDDSPTYRCPCENLVFADDAGLCGVCEEIPNSGTQWLCRDCQKKCKHCGEIYCEDHLEDHEAECDEREPTEAQLEDMMDPERGLDSQCMTERDRESIRAAGRGHLLR
jgi:hypothetical protein